eukprot:g7055.t1
MPTLRKEIRLTESEKNVFEVLQQTTSYFDLGVTLRCAGGWVRDKLLGRNSDDIDIAIDTMLGANFAEKVNDYLTIHGESVEKVAVIETNPEQSKHLETARIKIHGLQLDLVNLRSETYSQHSRVPQMNFGTATEDAFRRDLTINSMFYNINEAQVEDFTENGMEDLRNGVIRTPLPPLETFLDDPLRVLRAVRFAARFSFELDHQLSKAAMSEIVLEALSKKISRERIGTEVDGMFKGPDPLTAMQHLVDLKLFSTVFLLPQNLQSIEFGPNGLIVMKEALRFLRCNAHQVELNSDDRRLYLLAALLVPIRLLKGPHMSGKGKRSFCSASSHVTWEGLKWRMKDGEDVERLHGFIPELIAIHNPAGLTIKTSEHENDEFTSNKRVQLGLWLRKMKSIWKLGVLLAPMFTMMESLPVGINPQDCHLYDFVIQFNKDINSPEDAASKRLDFYGKLMQMIQEHNLENCWEMKPLLDGRTVMTELGIEKGGPILGELLNQVIKWQLAYPEGSKDECVAFLKTLHERKQMAVCNA